MHLSGKLIENEKQHDVSYEYTEPVPADGISHRVGKIYLPSGLVVRAGAHAKLIINDGSELNILVTKLKQFNGYIEFEQNP
jgi:hypothetical protein